MRKIFKVLAVCYVVVTILSNTPPIRYILSYAIDQYHYRYTNASGSFTFITESGEIENSRTAFSRFVAKTHPIPQDTVMYRVFWRNPLAFWRYYSYFFDNRYNLPYKNWADIKKIRDQTPKVIDSKQQYDWQDF